MAEGGDNSNLDDLKSQRTDIEISLRKTLVKGEVRYLLDTHWFKNWKKYVGFDKWDSTPIGDQTAHPGPIDNKPLLKDPESGEMKEHLVEELDYIFLTSDAWEMLVNRYGLVEGQEPIVRNVVENGLYVKLCQVEVYLMEIRLCENSNLENYFVKKFSKTDTIETIENDMRNMFHIPEDKETRLWNKYTCQTYEQFNRKDSTIQDSGLYQGQTIVIEQKNDDGTWPRQVQCTNTTLGPVIASGSERKQYGGTTTTTTAMSTRYSSSGYGNYSYFNESGTGNEKPGLCGLNNLGNTCFMNSALQCMSNAPPLTRYFLEDHYWSELNTENPLGMRGEIAKSFADLVKTMWSGKYSGTAPRNFKMQVGKFAPQFSGYQQQDAQELMAFLLDGLHEDLNRIKKKPYIELRDSDGRPDEVVADEAWQNYRKRNDSIIVDLFHGLLKSTLVCPDCNKVSVTFDPFGYLSLPLPVKKERQIEVFFVSADPNVTTMQYKLTVPKAGSVTDLCEALRVYTNVPINSMLVTDIYDHKIHKVFTKEECLSGIMDRDYIFIYQIPDDPDSIILPVYLRYKRIKLGGRNDNRATFFGNPLVVSVPRKNCTYQMLYESILKRMSSYVKEPLSSDQWWAKSKDEGAADGGNEVEMDEDEDEKDSPQEEDEGIDSPEENEVANGETKPHYMFTMSLINSCGNTEFEKLKDDGQPISFLHRPYLMIEWNPKAKELFYDEKMADSLNQHESSTTTNRFQQKRQVIQLNECLELFTTTEKLSADDSWYCPGCKKHQQATKKFDLWSLPKVLVLSFKRFSYNRYLRDKIDTLVEFPVKNLNMQKYVINQDHGPVVYNLVAVSNHYGGMGGGHYTAYAKNKDDQNWYYFDDNSVSAATEDAVVSKAAYVLFYVRKDADETITPSAVKDLPAALGSPQTTDSTSNGISESNDMDIS